MFKLSSKSYQSVNRERNRNETGPPDPKINPSRVWWWSCCIARCISIACGCRAGGVRLHYNSPGALFSSAHLSSTAEAAASASKFWPILCEGVWHDTKLPFYKRNHRFVLVAGCVCVSKLFVCAQNGCVLFWDLCAASSASLFSRCPSRCCWCCWRSMLMFRSVTVIRATAVCVRLLLLV